MPWQPPEAIEEIAFQERFDLNQIFRHPTIKVPALR
jgi:hypothetical protein